jgi:sugar phosphate permease
VFYLLEAKGALDTAAAAVTVSGLELGGLLGGTLSGVLSDRAIRAARSNPDAGVVGRRVRIVMAYTAGCIGMLIALRSVPAGAGAAGLQWATIGLLGFAIYGPQMLIGLCGAELISPRSVGASQGVLGLISYAGAAAAGIPLSFMQVCVCVCSFLALCVTELKWFALKCCCASPAPSSPSHTPPHCLQCVVAGQGTPQRDTYRSPNPMWMPAALSALQQP